LRKGGQNKKVNVFKIFVKNFSPVYKTSPVLFAACIIFVIMHGISWAAETLFLQKFFDNATSLFSGENNIPLLVTSLLILGLAYIVNQILNGIVNYLPRVFTNKANGILSREIHEKMSRLAPIDFEDTNKLDDINKAEEGKNNAVWFVMIWIFIFTFYLPFFIFMSWYLFSLKPILVISILLAFIPTIISQLVRTKVFDRLEDKSAPVRREYEYYRDCMVSREYYKETRLLGAFEYFKKLYIDRLKLLKNLSYKANLRTNLFGLGMNVLTAIGYSLTLFMLFDALMKKEISLGAFAAVFNSISLIYSIADEVISRHIRDIASMAGTIQNYINFLDMPERTGLDAEISADCDITLEDVSFAYPGAKEFAVKNASLTIKNGETLAIVGENGSGKTTLIRLITGLYLPSQGRIQHGPYDTRQVSMKSLFKNISAVFQRYQRYQMTLADNIGISDTSNMPLEETLDKVCAMSGLDVDDASFPNGYDTMLSREFNGVDLSGGQWQRVAIARGFFRNHNVIILDEPTAAIDPFEESRIYNQFARMSKDKTAIIVTHRLGSVKLADRVVVMKNGEIVEIGTHDDLLAAGGEYARLYKAQEQWYEQKEIRVAE